MVASTPPIKGDSRPEADKYDIGQSDTDGVVTHGNKPILRFLTCGSVDDGKSTLIGRLLYDCQQIHSDTLEAIRRDSVSPNRSDGELDLSLLVDGLQAEREQGITIDVAYRYFSTPKRSFIVADTPGHEQYTRNMVTGASNCDLSVILIDARHGITVQTKRHACISHLLGLSHIVVAINKMDLVQYSEARYREIEQEFAQLARELGVPQVSAIPVSALTGENVSRLSDTMPWYRGPSLLEKLESVEVTRASKTGPLRLSVQWVCRPNPDFRGYAGTIASGSLRAGETIMVLPGGQTASVESIVGSNRDQEQAGAAVMVTLSNAVDVARGAVLSSIANQPASTDVVIADIIWMSEKPMLQGRRYLLHIGTQSETCQISAVKHRLDVNKLDRLEGRELALNDIGQCQVMTSRPIVCERYDQNRSLGSFILIDRFSNETVGAGMIRDWPATPRNIHWQKVDVTKKARANLKHQRPCCLWFTGLSGAGKSTLANLLEERLCARGQHTYLLDGDNLRHGLNSDLGFSDVDRIENIRRVSEVARLMVDAGLITLVSFISPFRAERSAARERFDPEEFLELYVSTPLEVCEMRDPKGLYAKARAGQIKNFTGISSAYEEPLSPELTLNAGVKTSEALVDEIIDALHALDIIDPH